MKYDDYLADQMRVGQAARRFLLRALALISGCAIGFILWRWGKALWFEWRWRRFNLGYSLDDELAAWDALSDEAFYNFEAMLDSTSGGDDNRCDVPSAARKC